MKRYMTLLTAVVFGGLVMQTGIVSAKGDGNNGNRKNGNGNNQSQSSQQSMKVAKINKSGMKLSQLGVGNDKSVQGNRVGIQEGQGTRRPKLVQSNIEGWKQIGESFGHGKSKHDKKKDQAVLGPGRPDGRVEVPASSSQATLLLQTAGTVQLHTTPAKPTTVPARDGYVWNNGHWERAKANGTSVSTAGAPVNAMVQVTDHRPVKGRGDYVVPPPVAGKDHSSVKVTVSVPKELTGQTVYGSGIGIGDLIHIHNPKTIIDALPPWGFTVADDPRDHRTPNDSRKNKK